MCNLCYPNMCVSMVQSTSLEEVPAEAPKEAPRHSPAKAARRMLTQALGFSVLSPSSRGLDRNAPLNQPLSVSIEAGLRHCEGDTAVASVVVTNVNSKASDSDEGLRVRDAAVKNLHFAEQYVLSPFLFMSISHLRHLTSNCSSSPSLL